MGHYRSVGQPPPMMVLRVSSGSFSDSEMIYTGLGKGPEVLNNDSVELGLPPLAEQVSGLWS